MRFLDLFLDVVINAEDGSWDELDREELDLALEQGAIDRATHALALERVRRLERTIDGQEAAWRALCGGCGRHFVRSKRRMETLEKYFELLKQGGADLAMPNRGPKRKDGPMDRLSLSIRMQSLRAKPLLSAKKPSWKETREMKSKVCNPRPVQFPGQDGAGHGGLRHRRIRHGAGQTGWRSTRCGIRERYRTISALCWWNRAQGNDKKATAKTAAAFYCNKKDRKISLRWSPRAPRFLPLPRWAPLRYRRRRWPRQWVRRLLR